MHGEEGALAGGHHIARQDELLVGIILPCNNHQKCHAIMRLFPHELVALLPSAKRGCFHMSL